MSIEDIMLNPPAIVQSAELSEAQLVAGIARAATRDNFSVGRYALDWHQRYSRDGSDAALARTVNETTPDANVSEQYIRLCRIVAAEFPTQVGNLSWTHHRTAVEGDKAHAADWLDKAAAKGWTVAQLREAIQGRTAKAGASTKRPASSCSLKDLLRGRAPWNDPAYVAEVLRANEGYVLGKREQLQKLSAHLRNTADVIQQTLSEQNNQRRR